MSAGGLSILYVGEMYEGATCLQRMETLRELGCSVTPINTRPEDVRRRERQFATRLRRKLFGHLDLAAANGLVAAAVRSRPFDALWIDKGQTISPDTLRRVRTASPGCRIVGYSPDDMMNPANQSRAFLAALPLYDVYFTTKSYNVAELQAIGCRRAVLVGNGYDPKVHRPVEVSDADRKAIGGPVGFIGQWEADRAESLCFLARNGIEVRVWGFTWERLKSPPPGLKLENRPLWQHDYAKAICAFDINLAFLRKVNRDLQTTRSVEIPACGAFMLAERTDEHRSLFEEGKEAEFFAGNAELLDKVRFYLANPDRRRAVAAAGRERCLRSGYSNPDRMRSMLSIIEGPAPSGL